MPPAVGSISPSPVKLPATATAVVPFSSSFTTTGSLSPSQKDTVLEWYKGEFAAANAIIDSLCHHLVQIKTTAHGGGDGGHLPEGYKRAFAAIHRRRLNWIPVLQTQKYYSIADVAKELRRAAAVTATVKGGCCGGAGGEKVERCECGDRVKGSVSEGDDSPVSEITDSGSHEVQATIDHTEVCDDHENCTTRREQIQVTKGFIAKEHVRGNMINVVRGLKKFENVFTVSELCKLRTFVDELRKAGQNGELLGETYMLFNKQVKTNKREQIQLGVPLFGNVKDDATNEQQKSNNEPIPELIQSVIDHLVQWQVLPDNKKPNGCIINYFDEGEYSQPFLKPPHLDQPICTLVLSESTMAFGHFLVNDGEGNFKGQLTLSMKEGSVVVMRNYSADKAKHVMCASPTKRVTITFIKIRPNHLDAQVPTPLPPLNQAMTLWQPQTLQNGPPVEAFPKWGVVRAPLVMVAPVRPMTMNPRMPCGGTGVFLPWTVGSSKNERHLPPRAQKGRFLTLSHNKGHVSDTMLDPGVEGRMT